MPFEACALVLQCNVIPCIEFRFTSSINKTTRASQYRTCPTDPHSARQRSQPWLLKCPRMYHFRPTACTWPHAAATQREIRCSNTRAWPSRMARLTECCQMSRRYFVARRRLSHCARRYEHKKTCSAPLAFALPRTHVELKKIAPRSPNAIAPSSVNVSSVGDCSSSTRFSVRECNKDKIELKETPAVL